jgi:signal transduction histidine kinase
MDGTVVDVEVQVRGIEIDGERLLYASSRDITEGKQYKESLEKAVTQRTSELVAARQKAEQANQAKTRFLANVSHEMRTPMHAILSYASLTRRRVEDAKAAGYLDKMIQSADRLNRTLTNLLNLADFEKDAADFNFSRGDLRQIVETLVHEDAGAIAAKDIELRVSGAPELVGEMDVSRIAQVVGHLLENAIQFSPDGASIFVELASGRSSVRDGNLDCLLMSVHDQGIGIPASEQARVFDPFVLGLDTDGKTGGGGMGLAVSQRIIAAHGGRIWIDSPVECAELRMQGSPGHVGTTVHVAIPVRQMRQATRIPAA